MVATIIELDNIDGALLNFRFLVQSVIPQDISWQANT